jgi:hypothetical protein
MQLKGLGKLKKLIQFIWSRTRDLPACSVVPQPLRYCMLSATAIKITTQEILSNALDFISVKFA